MNKLPEKLTLLRKHYGYAQGDLANKLAVPVATYMNWENGNAIPAIHQLKILADLFNVSVDALADNTKEIVIPKSNLSDSVTIPFMDPASAALTQQMTAADPLENTQDASGGTRVMNTTQFEPTQVEEIADTREAGTVQVEAPEEEEEAEETEERPLRKKPAPKKKSNKKLSKKQIGMIGGIVAAALVLVIIVIVAFNGGKSSSKVSLTTTNRLAEGDKYTLYVNNAGKLKTYGQFNAVSQFAGSVQVSAYGSHALGLKNNGTVVSNTGEDLSDWKDITMIAAGADHSVGLKSDGTVVCNGNENACQVSDWENIASVYAGNGITIGLTKDGEMKAAGSVNSAIANQTGVKSVVASDNMIAMILEDGTVKTSALGSAQVLDTSSWKDITGAAIGTDAMLGINKNGTVSLAGGDDDMKTIVSGWTNIQHVAAYQGTYVAVDKAGNLYGTGDNTYGQYEKSSAIETSASADTTLAAPQNITATATTANLSIKWDSVENADYYEVSITGMDTIKAASNSTSVPAADLKEDKEYTISVVAKANDPKKYPDSEAGTITYRYVPKSEQLAAPANITGQSQTGAWTISWDAVENADYYVVNLDGGPDQKTEANKITLNLAGTNVGNGTSHNIAVTAYSNSSAYTTSETGKAVLTYSIEQYDVIFHFRLSGSNTDLNSAKYVLPAGQEITAQNVFQQMPEDFQASCSVLDSTQKFKITGKADYVIEVQKAAVNTETTPENQNKKEN